MLNLLRGNTSNIKRVKAKNGYESILKNTETHSKVSENFIKDILRGQSIDFEVDNGLPKNWRLVVQKMHSTNDVLNTEGYLLQQIESTKNSDMRELFKTNLNANQQRIASFQNKCIDKEMDLINESEFNEIGKDLDSRIIANFTGKELPKVIQQYLANGRKYVPFFGSTREEVAQKFMAEIAAILNTMLPRRDSNLFTPTQLVDNIRYNLTNPDIDPDVLSILRNIITRIEVTKENILNQQDFKGPDDEKQWILNILKLFVDEDRLLLESDKGLGFSLLTTHQVLSLYQTINETQSFILTDLTDETYLEWVAQLKKERCPTIPDAIVKLLDNSMIQNFYNTKGKIAMLRLLIKSGKINNPSPESFKNLTARTIKAGTDDPVNGVSDIIRVVTRHFMKNLKAYILDEYGVDFTVNGCEDAYNRIEKLEPVHSLTDTVNMQGDVTEMYPNCVFPVVMRAFKNIGIILKVSKEVMSFVTGGIYVLMRANVVRQPSGVYQMGKENPERMGLSIGDPAAAEISDITLMIYEIDMIKTLKREKLLTNLQLYLRFRDDIDTRIQGTVEEKCKIIWIILTHFPSCFNIKASISFFTSKFLDIKRIIRVGEKERLALLRKKNNSYDITRASSNTSSNAKSSAMNCYAYRMMRRTNWKMDSKHQLRTNTLILQRRGHTSEDFTKILNKVKNRVKISKRENSTKTGSTKRVDKRFLPPVTWDEVTSNHKRIKFILKRSNVFTKYRQPGYKSGRKVLQLIFTKKTFMKRMRTKLPNQ